MPFIILKKSVLTMSWMKFLYLTQDYSAIESSFIKFNVAIKVDPEVIAHFLAYLVQDKESIQDNGIYDFYCKEIEANNNIKKLFTHETVFSPFHVRKIAIGMSIDREDTLKEAVYPKKSEGKQKTKHKKNFEVEIIFETEEKNKSELEQVHINFHIEYAKGKTLDESIFSLEKTVNYFMSLYSKAKDELISLNLENFEESGYQVAKKSLFGLTEYKKKNQVLIDGESLKSQVLSLQKNTPLTTLKLENAHIGIEAIKALSDILEKNVTLTHLDLSNNPLGFAGAKILFLALQKNTILQGLYLANTQLGDQGVFDVADYLRKNERLTGLSLNNNEITHLGIKALASALENKPMQKLLLGGNNLGLEGINTLMPALEKSKTLVFLQLSRDEIVSEGAKILAYFLAMNTTLMRLNLRGNQLGPSGSHAIALSLGKNTTLKCINLNANQIGEPLVNDVIFILEHNTSLMVLDVVGNGLSDDHIKKIIPALEKNTTIQTLEIIPNQQKFNSESNVPRDSLKKALTSLLLRNFKLFSEKTVSPNLTSEIGDTLKIGSPLTTSFQRNTFDQHREQSNSINQNTSDSLYEDLFLSTSSRDQFFQKKEVSKVVSYEPASFSETLMPRSYSPLFFPAEFYGDSREEKILKELKRITAREWKKTNDFFYYIAESKAVGENICSYFKSCHIGAVLKNQKRVQIKHISLEAILKINVYAGIKNEHIHTTQKV